MSESTIMIEAPGKLILLGEYAVLEQAPALVAAVNKQCKVRVESRYDSIFHFEAPNLDIPDVEFILDDDGEAHLVGNYTAEVRKKLGFVFSILNYVTLRSEQPIPGAEIHIDTGDFYHHQSGHKFGLGSSAALTVGLMQALNEHMGETAWMKSLYYEALQAHRIAQGKLGSGVDIGASTSGGVIHYRMPKSGEGVHEAIHKCEWPDDLQMIPVWTGSSASTRTLVNRVKTFQQAAPTAYRRIMDRMVDLSVQGSEAFQLGSSDAFLGIVDEFLDQERLLGRSSGAPIVSEVHEHLSVIVSNAGGVYKPSGAGGGDIGIAFCDNQAAYDRITNTINESPFEILDLAIQLEGVKSTQTYEVS